MVLLTGAKIFGILFSIAIPMYLGRKLPVETYGTYKQVMLFFWFSQVALNLGFDDSVYYYARRDNDKFPLFSFNALVFNLGITGLIWLFICIYKTEISVLIGNPALADYFPLLGFLILGTVSSMQIEGLLIVGLDRFKDRLWVEMATELLKSLAIIGGFYFFDSLYIVLLFLSLIMASRLAATVLIIRSNQLKRKISFRESPKYFMTQFKFGIPLGLSRLFQNLLNMENFYISSLFSMAQFTYYSVGCFENPIVNAGRVSMMEMANIEMGEAMKHEDQKKAIEIWRNMSRKLFLFIVPFVTYMIFFAHEIIVFIFSSKYLLSVPYFMVFNLFLIVGALNPEALFKASSRTSELLRIRLMGVLLGIGFLVGGAYWGGPLLALVGKILGVFLMNVFGLVIGARFYNVHFWQLFRWKDLMGVFVLSCFLSFLLRIIFSALSPSFFSLSFLGNPFWVLAFSFSLYVLFHFLLSCKFHLIKDDEIYYLHTFFKKYIFFL